MTATGNRRRERAIVRDMLRVYAVPANRESNWNDLQPALEAAARLHGLTVPWGSRQLRLQLVVRNRTPRPEEAPRTPLPLERLLQQAKRRRRTGREQGALFDDR